MTTVGRITEPFGVIARGARADLLLITGNPLKDVRAAAAREGVVLNGRWYSERELERQTRASGR